MDTMDYLRERVEILEHHTEALGRRVDLIGRRLRWWRGLACGLIVLGLVSLPLPSGTAQEQSPGAGDLARRLSALEYKLTHFSGGANEVVIAGANLRIVNGLGATGTTNGLGNLIVGYNELRTNPASPDVRTGSHNLVVGRQNNFSSFGGLVVGFSNEISGEFASVTVGSDNKAIGNFSSVSGGGAGNVANGIAAAVSGGRNNTARWLVLLSQWRHRQYGRWRLRIRQWGLSQLGKWRSRLS